jgi:hypothetical protein
VEGQPASEPGMTGAIDAIRGLEGTSGQLTVQRRLIRG